VEAVNAHAPTADAAWAEAHDRVRAYLSAHGVPAARVEEMTGQVLRFARERHAAHPDLPPVEIAADAAMLLIDGWIQTIVGLDPSESAGRRLAHERAAVHLADLPTRWPDQFLRDEPPPEEMRRELRTTYVEAGPDLEFSNMTPRAIELGPVSEVADTTWRTFDKWPFLRGVATWLLYLGALAAAFYAVRF
jgi:hypothetical protein